MPRHEVSVPETQAVSLISPYAGKTVLELIAGQTQSPLEANYPAPSTPPVEVPTGTKSGEGWAQINDDDDTDVYYG